MMSWADYADLLKEAETVLDQLVGPVDEQRRAELFRQFAMNLSQGYFLIFQADADYPEFVPFENSTFLLQPNPDAVYYYASVDGAGTYRVSGERGNAVVAGFATGNRIIGMDDQPGQGFENYDLDDLALDEEGRFDIMFSAERPEGWAGDWRYLNPAADFILLRQFSYDWGRDRDVRLAIERIDPRPPRPRLSPEETDARLRRLFAYARRLSAVAAGAVRRPFAGGFVNRFHLHSFADLGNGQSWPQAYFEMVFDIAPDEALVIESELPDVRPYWNLQVADGLWNQVDVLYRQSSLNGRTASVDADGKFRAVLSAQDPGYANWLDTGGHLLGLLIGRWYRCSSQPVPTVTRMKLADVASHLGERSALIDAAGRASQMRDRIVGTQMRRKW